MSCVTSPDRRRRDEQLTLTICVITVLFQATVLAFQPGFVPFVCGLILYALGIALSIWAVARYRR